MGGGRLCSADTRKGRGRPNTVGASFPLAASEGGDDAAFCAADAVVYPVRYEDDAGIICDEAGWAGKARLCKRAVCLPLLAALAR